MCVHFYSLLQIRHWMMKISDFSLKSSSYVVFPFFLFPWQQLYYAFRFVCHFTGASSGGSIHHLNGMPVNYLLTLLCCLAVLTATTTATTITATVTSITMTLATIAATASATKEEKVTSRRTSRTTTKTTTAATTTTTRNSSYSSSNCIVTYNLLSHIVFR